MHQLYLHASTSRQLSTGFTLRLPTQNSEEPISQKQQEILAGREATVHKLVLSLAASPRALELNKEASELFAKAEGWMYNPDRQKSIPEAQRMTLDSKIDDIVRELPSLPKLTSEQIENECNAFPDDKIQITDYVR